MSGEGVDSKAEADTPMPEGVDSKIEADTVGDGSGACMEFEDLKLEGNIFVVASLYRPRSLSLSHTHTYMHTHTHRH